MTLYKNGRHKVIYFKSSDSSKQSAQILKHFHLIIFTYHYKICPCLFP